MFTECVCSSLSASSPSVSSDNYTLSSSSSSSSATETSWVDSLSPSTRRLLGISLALSAGCMYGLNFNPPQHLIDSGKGASTHGIDYVFSHFCGILLTSTTYMIAYSLCKRNRPQLLPQIVLPGLLSGCGWAIAQIAWFIGECVDTVCRHMCDCAGSVR